MSNDLIKLRKTEGLGIGTGSGGTGSGSITVPAEPADPGGWVIDGNGDYVFVVFPPRQPPNRVDIPNN